MKQIGSNNEAIYESSHAMENISLNDLVRDFIIVRNRTLDIFKPLKIEDAVIQSHTFGSPPNWHLAHVSWFFHKILERYGRTLTQTSDHCINLEYLNSYYQRYGNILPKSERGKFPRPTVQQTLEYRLFIERNVISFLREKRKEEDDLNNKGIASASRLEELKYDIILGNQHEMQHQELMIYDFQHYFQRFQDPEDSYNPATPIVNPQQTTGVVEKPTGMVEVPEGIYEMGFNGGNDLFCYDNELPEHKVYLQPFKIDIAPVSNGEFIKFIEDGGYDDFSYWLADGWDLVNEEEWRAPLYWERKGDVWMKKDFRGFREIDLDEPVTNVS